MSANDLEFIFDGVYNQLRFNPVHFEKIISQIYFTSDERALEILKENDFLKNENIRIKDELDQTGFVDT